MVRITLNGTPVALDVPPDTSLLHALRGPAGLSGPRFGCGTEQCGVYAVHTAEGWRRGPPDRPSRQSILDHKRFESAEAWRKWGGASWLQRSVVAPGAGMYGDA